MRPAFHFTAERGWINDPHGITWHDGRYHQFHQHLPDRLEWGPACRWGHASSADLLTWTHHPSALEPGDGDDGIWTGCLVQPPGRSGQAPRILYTAATLPDPAIARIRSATPVDASWDRWVKGPVVVEAPTDLDLIAFRDPFVVGEGDGWRMYVGAGDRDGHAYALTWVSHDLEDWRYDGVALSRSGADRDPWTGAVWECPQILDLDGRRVMITSVWQDDVPQHPAYAVGDADPDRPGRMIASAWGRLGFGDSSYAPSFFRDRDDRPCLVFWMRGVEDRAAGWAGCHSVPYVVRVVGDHVVLEPHPTLTASRGPALPAGERAVGGFDLEWQPLGDGDRLTLAGGGVETARLEVAGGRLVLQQDAGSAAMPWSGGRVRAVVDGPVLEVSTTDGLLGGPIPPTDAWASADGGCQAWRVEPSAQPPPLRA